MNILRGLAYEAMRLTFFFQDVSILVVHTFFFFTFSQWIYGVLFFFQHCVQPLLEVGAVLAIHLVIRLNEDIARAVQDGTLVNALLLRFQDAIRDAVRNAGPRVHDRAPAPPVHWPAPLQIPPGCDERHDVPNAFKCPITMSIMRVPASTPTGETFDYEELGKWILMRGKAERHRAPPQPLSTLGDRKVARCARCQSFLAAAGTAAGRLRSRDTAGDDHGRSWGPSWGARQSKNHIMGAIHW